MVFRYVDFSAVVDETRLMTLADWKPLPLEYRYPSGLKILAPHVSRSAYG